MKRTTTEPVCIQVLREARPDIVIKVTREVDDYASWDEGMGEQPAHLTPYVFTVAALAIRDGEMLRGEATLSESWCADDEDVSEIHGYLPQMVDEAVAELDKVLRALA